MKAFLFILFSVLFNSPVQGKSIQSALRIMSSEKLVIKDQTLHEAIKSSITAIESDLFPGDEIPISITTPKSKNVRKSFSVEPTFLGEILAIIAARFNHSLSFDDDTSTIAIVNRDNGYFLFDLHEPFRKGVLDGKRGVDTVFWEKNIRVEGVSGGLEMLKTKPRVYLDLIRLRVLWKRGWFGDVEEHKKLAYPNSLQRSKSQ